MQERKYKHKSPQGQEEHLEAIYEELTRSPQQNPFRSTATVKDQLAAILEHAKDVTRQRKNEEQQKSYSVSWALGMLGIASVIFLFNGLGSPGDWEWLNENRFAIRLWGIGLAAVFVGISIERSSFFKSLWGFGFTKLIASVAVSGLVVFSTGKAASLINAVFSQDASAFPLTRAIVAALLVFQYAYPLLIVVALFALVHTFHLADWIANKFLGKDSYTAPPVHSFVLPIVALILLLFSSKWVNTDFSNEVWPAKVYRLAHLLDFNSNHACANLSKDRSVIFIGPEQRFVLVDANQVQTDDMESFVDGEASSRISVPKHFDRLACQLPVPAPSKIPGQASGPVPGPTSLQ